MPRTRGERKGQAAPEGPSVKDGASIEESRNDAGGGLFATLTAAQEQAASGEPGSVVEQLPLAKIAPHPDNPAHRHEDRLELEDLAADIKSAGVLTPAIVATRAELVRRAPELNERIDPSAGWVILAGHRRWGASHVAEQATLPCLVRDDLADPVEIIKVFLRENKQRLAISPIEEAQAYERLRNKKLSQRSIAVAMNTSQSNISKTLDLLKLPTDVKQAITKGEISQHAARKLLDIPAERRTETYQHALQQTVAPSGDPQPEQIDIPAAVRREEARIERERSERAAREQLTNEGLPEIDPKEKWGSNSWQHRVHENDVAAERDAGRVVGAVIEAGQVHYYSDHPAPHLRRAMQSDPTTGRSPSEQGDEVEDDPTLLERRTAHQSAVSARYDACRRLVGDYSELAVRTVIDILADGVLVGEVEAGAFRFNAPIRAWLGIEYDGDRDLEAAIEDRSLAHRLAVAVVLAANEDEAGQKHYAAGTPWPPVIERHINRLVELGYHELSEYEQSKLADVGTDD